MFMNSAGVSQSDFIFSNVEEKIITYLKRLSGGVTVANISRNTKIPRATVFYNLRKLKHKKIVTRTYMARRLLWYIHNRQHITNTYSAFFRKPPRL